LHEHVSWQLYRNLLNIKVTDQRSKLHGLFVWIFFVSTILFELVVLDERALCVTYVKKLTSLKHSVRTMWWCQSTKTVKIFSETLDGAMHGASLRKNRGDISHISRVIANFGSKFVAMATRVGRGRLW